METSQEKLTSAEIGKLWATYTGNTMSRCVLKYYQQHVEDKEIENVLEDALRLSESLIEQAKKFLTNEEFPLPKGFTDEDVNPGAPRLFLDEFYLHYLKYMGKAGMTIYSLAIPLASRMDIKIFFKDTLESTVDLLIKVDKVLMDKGYAVLPPVIPTPERIDFVKKQSYLTGFFGESRPVHALEIAHFYDSIENDMASKALLVGFSQVTSNERIKEFFLRGRNITERHAKACAAKLHQDNLPSHEYLDHLVTTSNVPPFSEKLMVSHKMEMFSMKIRSYANAASLNGRRDIGAMYSRFLMENALYTEDAANILIDHGWLEQIPQAVDRNDLASP
ncbi:DUF3231 family protein [Virgibacillus xinjiangensis]|uniref:DUF3231 family protein n=1 Tax=Virgibacillus xinjiangensis TaxID=393090 RepID=A0ABV7CWC2_9BACI